ncbi:hypothetical protein E2C01_101380 [Portunus trituberculatus]|uniref:Uncharacterized protein n=1 Tax=Portunus trituberculatus TaxID=210409 RepID=A0A5B7KJZ5_PORTR|nr:hypothetical protein [Portunus trituberculatus]
MARTAEGEFYDIIGTATVLEPGVLLVVFNDGIPAEYHVLDTDYTNFTAVYNCEQLGELRVSTKAVFSVNKECFFIYRFFFFVSYDIQ